MALNHSRWVKRVDEGGVIRDAIEYYDKDWKGNTYNSTIIDPEKEDNPRQKALEIFEERQEKMQKSFEEWQDKIEKQKREFERKGQEYCVLNNGTVVPVIRKKYFDFEK